jgi:hypothetical protein
LIFIFQLTTAQQLHFAEIISLATLKNPRLTVILTSFPSLSLPRQSARSFQANNDIN